jgi:hypothetical protein
MTLNLWKLSLILILVVGGGLFVANLLNKPMVIVPSGAPSASEPSVPAKPVAVSSAAAAPYQVANLPTQKVLTIPSHAFQSFNNCAPAALSIALSYYDIYKTQQQLAASLRPYNNPQGINDDKSTTPDELGAEAEKFGLIPYYRVNGDIDLLRQFIAADIPVVMRTLLHADEDFAHYRVVKGYDNATKEIIQDDSYEGKNLRFSYSKFLDLWQQFNYEYLILVSPDKQAVAEGILGENLDPVASWQGAVRTAEAELAQDSNDIRARFNLSVALYNIGDYKRSVQEFEKISSRLPQIVLWYQMQPINSYFELGDHAKVMSWANAILARNISFSELYILRGKVYLQQGRPELAKKEFEQALFYNKNLKAAQEALASV